MKVGLDAVRWASPLAAAVLSASAAAIVAVGPACVREKAPPVGGAPDASVVAVVAQPQMTSLPSPLSAVPVAPPIPRASVENSVNPDRLPPWPGPTGTVEGAVRVKGDAAPETPVEPPRACAAARATYGKLFREGLGRTLADVLVAVTEFDGFVPARSDARRVEIRDCAYQTRTVDVTYGQRIDVWNREATQSFVPLLLGGEAAADMVAIPRGDAVRLYPTKVGHYVLADGMKRTWMHADVFVLKYATHVVTGLDGRYRIDGIPVGRVKLSAYLPAIDEHVDIPVDVRAGETTTADATLEFDAKRHAARAAPSASGSARPAR